MRKRSSKKSADEQVAEQAPGQEPTTEPTPDGKNPAAVALGRLGGKKGGPARAAKLTKEQRAAIARKAAQVRWKNQAQEGQSSSGGP